MSKMMVSEEMKTPRPRRRAAPPAVLGRVLLAVTGGIYRQRRGFPVLPQYLEPVGRHLYLYREGDRRPADGDADYRPGNRSVGSLDDGAQLNGDGLRAAAGMDTPLLVVIGWA